jgi:hypothetical protein
MHMSKSIRLSEEAYERLVGIGASLCRFTPFPIRSLVGGGSVMFGGVLNTPMLSIPAPLRTRQPLLPFAA